MTPNCPPPVRKHCVQLQHSLEPASQVVPTPLHVGTVQKNPPSSGKQRAPPQHWSENWQAWLVAIQQGAWPVYPVGQLLEQVPPGHPPKHRGTPLESTLHTVFFPSQQS